MELLGNNPSMQDLIQKLNEVVESLNTNLSSTNSEITEVKELVSFGSNILASRLNEKLWYFKTQELMTASTELCEGDSCFILNPGSNTGEGTFEYWYIYKTTDVGEILDSYVELANPDLVGVKIQELTFKALLSKFDSIKKFSFLDLVTTATETNPGKALDAIVGKLLADRIGNLGELSTVDKNSLVGAIKEVKTIVEDNYSENTKKIDSKAERTELQTETSERKQEIAVERARINNLLKSTSDTVTSTCEVSDEYGGNASAEVSSDGINVQIKLTNFQFLKTWESSDGTEATASPEKILDLPNHSFAPFEERTVVHIDGTLSYYIENDSLYVTSSTATISIFGDVTISYTIIDSLQSEVADIRVGANGKVYDTAGEAVRGQVSELKDDLVDISKTFIVNNLVWEDGYVGTSGKKNSGGDCLTSNAIKLKKGESLVVKCCGYLTAISIISSCNKEGVPIAMLVRSIDSTERIYRYAATEDMYVCVSYHITSGYATVVSRISSVYEMNKAIEENGTYIPYLDYMTNVDGLTWESGYISPSGNKSDDIDSRRCLPFKMFKGQTIDVYASGYLTYTSIISECNEVGDNIVPVAISTDSNAHHYTHTFDKDTYVILSYHIDAKVTVDIRAYQKLFERKEATDTKTEYQPTWNNGFYIGSNGGKSSESKCHYSNPIELKKGQVIQYQGMGFREYVSIISMTNESMSAFGSLVISSNADQTEGIYKYQAKHDCLVTLCGYHTKDNGAPVVEKVYIYEEKLEEDTRDYSTFVGCFNKVVCIGDSITEGDQGPTFGANLTQRVTPWNYPYYLAKNTGWTCDNKGHSGYTTIAWWDRHKNDDFSSYDTAIIFLGTNLGLTDTLASDVEPYTNYNDFANTNTGCYCKIISKLKADNPMIKIFILGTYNVEQKTYWRTTQKVLAKIATKYNIPFHPTFGETEVANIFDMKYHRTSLDAHMTSMGYMIFAKYVEHIMEQEAYKNQYVYNPVYPNYHS